MIEADLIIGRSYIVGSSLDEWRLVLIRSNQWKEAERYVFTNDYEELKLFPRSAIKKLLPEKINRDVYINLFQATKDGIIGAIFDNEESAVKFQTKDHEVSFKTVLSYRMPE